MMYSFKILCINYQCMVYFLVKISFILFGDRLRSKGTREQGRAALRLARS